MLQAPFETIAIATGALVLGALIGFGFRDHLAGVLERLLDWGGPA